MSKTVIYTITNLINNKIYLGYTTNFPLRRLQHLSTLRCNRHDNEHLQNAWNKHGEKNFTVEILDSCEPQFLVSQEHYWSNLLRVHDRNYGYNILPTHPYELANSHSEESKRKISEANKGRKMTKEHIEKIASQRRGRVSNRKGVKLSPDTINKLRLSHTGHKHSEETRRRMSEAQKRRYLCKI